MVDGKKSWAEKAIDWIQSTSAKLWSFLEAAYTGLVNLLHFFAKPEYVGSFAEGHDEHVPRLAENFYLRGRQLMATSVALAMLISVLIFVGVGTFLFPLTFTDINSENSKELENVSSELREILDSQNQADTDRLQAQERWHACEVIEAVHAVIKVPLRGDADDKITVAKHPLSDSDKYMLGRAAAIMNPELDMDLEIDFSHRVSNVSGTKTISANTCKVIRDRAAEFTAKSSSELYTDIQAVLKSPTCPEGKTGSSDADDCAAQRFDAFSTLRTDTVWAAKELRDAKDKFEKLTKQTKEFVEYNNEKAHRTLELQTKQAELIAQGAVETSSGAERWLRVLSVRVGAVVLFLFLTRIFLETYRYTVALAAFYRARGDAVQMLGKGSSKMPIDVESFAELLIAIGPENHRIDKVWSPESLLLRLTGAKLSPGSENSGEAPTAPED